MQYFGVGFLVLLFLEIMSIVWVADWLGGGFAFLLMIVSFIGGTMMLRHTGLSGILLAGAAIRSGDNISMYQMLWPNVIPLLGFCCSVRVLCPPLSRCCCFCRLKAGLRPK